MEGKGRRDGLMERATQWLDVPVNSMGTHPVLELLGDRELRLENYKGVLACTREEITVGSDQWVLRIGGKNLEIRAMRERDLLLTGRIERLELI